MSKLRPRWFRITTTIVAFLGLTMSFQNCSSGGGQDVRFTTAQGGLENSGNGTPYEGKPEPGKYYQVVPNFTCANGQPSIAAQINITKDDMTLQTVNPDCSRSSQALTAAQVEAPSYNLAQLGHKDGIFKKAEVVPDPTVAASETWCRSLDGSFDVLVDQPAGAALTSVLRSAAGIDTAFASARTQTGPLLAYAATGMNLSVQLNALSEKSAGQFSAALPGGTLSGAVSCRSTRKAPLAMNFLVLSRDTTNANLGGRAGADAFCLSQMTAHNFKGKVNAVVDAAHVRAFICDNAACNNLPPNRTFAFAFAGNTAVGGDTFQTNAAGSGPGNQDYWDTPGKFGGNYLWWSGRENGGNDNRWPTAASSTIVSCNNWTTSSNVITGSTGITYPYNTARWDNGGNICSDMNRVMCAVLAD